jgi:Cu/Ag efflux protein CusF
MQLHALRAGLGLAISSSLMLFASLSYASKHTARNTPAAKQGDTHHPKNWRFTMPKGDPAKGRAVFEKFECYYCHEVRGEQFPSPTEHAPELSQMGSMHPMEFFAQSIMDPNAVVPKEYRDSDGKSPMTNFTEKMTVKELIDVSAYVASLRPKGAPKSVSAQGQVVALAPERSEIVLNHGEIPGFMEAMTMGYKVSSPSLLKSVKPGDTVKFTVDTDKRVITKIARAQDQKR